AAGISIDVSAIEDAVQNLDPADPESMNEMFSGSMFIPEPEGAQKAAIEQLETLLALVEGWVDLVVTEAAKPLESASALREDRKSTRLNSSHVSISSAVFCLKKKTSPRGR